MSGLGGAGSTPPEVPEEFAAAYRAAYERALAAQSEHPHQAFEETEGDELPRRRGPARLRSHRAEREPRPQRERAPRPPRPPRPVREQRVPEPEPREAPAYRRPSPWLVPVLLGVLFLIMVLGAYVVGRMVADRVGVPQQSGQPSSLGSTPVPGGRT